MTAFDNLITWLGRPASDGAGAGALGGKGASLDRLGRLGFRVPPGFCLTTAAFKAQLAATVDAALGESGAADVVAVAGGLGAAPLEPGVQGALDAAVRRLVEEVGAAGFEPRFAVRSSAVGEDGSTASYAGLHETELDVAPDGVADAVRRCWASLWSPAAIAYRRRRNLSAADAEMAVVVQALVPADAAAVVFTRHPVTGRDDQLVITAVRGLGDAMVSGTVTPDTYVVDRSSRGVATFEAGEDPRGAALDDQTLGALIALSLDVEARFGEAVDIEAAVAGGTWYLLQARPITTGASVAAR
ncbi:MAG TPA: PEP/pyruvate-binding domain-containing protein [Candidatus Limnocylindria bacterium]|nr:PEP/pyruvate-binding domain-containing protein [Candidatus Limnocylindria bacterium]